MGDKDGILLNYARVAIQYKCISWYELSGLASARLKMKRKENNNILCRKIFNMLVQEAVLPTKSCVHFTDRQGNNGAIFNTEIKVKKYLFFHNHT